MSLGAAMLAVLIVGMGFTIWRQAEQLEKFATSERMTRELLLAPQALERDLDMRKRIASANLDVVREFQKADLEERKAMIEAAALKARSNPSREALQRSEIIRLKQRIEDLELELFLGPLAPAPADEDHGGK